MENSMQRISELNKIVGIPIAMVLSYRYTSYTPNRKYKFPINADFNNYDVLPNLLSNSESDIFMLTGLP